MTSSQSILEKTCISLSYILCGIKLPKRNIFFKINTFWWDDSERSSSSSFSTFTINNLFSSFFFYVSFLFSFFIFQTTFYEKINFSIENFSSIFISRFESKLPVPWTINIDNCFDYKLGHLFCIFVSVSDSKTESRLDFESIPLWNRKLNPEFRTRMF